MREREQERERERSAIAGRNEQKLTETQYSHSRGEQNVMVFGESAGAASVTVQLASPLAKGLIQKAGMESGAFAAWVSQPLESAATSYYRVAKKLGCVKRAAAGGNATSAFRSGSNGTDGTADGSAISAQEMEAKEAKAIDSKLVQKTEDVDIECLLSKSAQEVIRAAPLTVNFSPTDAFSQHGVPTAVAAFNPLHTLSFAFAPTIDNVVLTAHPLDLLQNNPEALNLMGSKGDRISVMQGWNADEGTLLAPIFPVLGLKSPDNVNASITNMLKTELAVNKFDDLMKVARAVFPGKKKKKATKEKKKASNDTSTFWDDFVSGFKEGWRKKEKEIDDGEERSSGSSSSSSSSGGDNNRRLSSSPSSSSAVLANFLSNFSLDSLSVREGDLGRENGGNDDNDGGSEDRSYYWSIVEMLTAAGFACPTLASAALLSKAGLDNVYVYEFAQPGGFDEGLGGFPEPWSNSSVKYPNSVGATHGSELPFVFDDEDEAEELWTEEAFPDIVGTGPMSSSDVRFLSLERALLFFSVPSLTLLLSRSLSLSLSLSLVLSLSLSLSLSIYI